MKVIRWVKYEGLVIGTNLTERGIGLLLFGIFLYTSSGIVRISKSEIDKDSYEACYMFGITIEDYKTELN